MIHIWHFLTSCDPWAPYDKALFAVMGIDAWQIQVFSPVNKNCLEGIWCRVISQTNYSTHQVCRILINSIGWRGLFRHPSLVNFFHPTLTLNPKSMLLNTDTQICQPDARHSTSARHWQSHLEFDAGHYEKFWVHTRHILAKGQLLVQSRRLTYKILFSRGTLKKVY